MFRKLIIASAVLAVSSNVAFASANYKEAGYKEEQPCPTFVYTTGPYIGLSVGDIINTASNNTYGPTNFTGYTGVLSAGWGALWGQFYLAGEIFGQLDGNITTSKDEDTNTVSPRTTSSYGISILPGYLISSNFLGYVRGSVLRSHFSETASSTNNTGWQLGLGVQTNLVQNWDLRAEYDYTRYTSVSNIGNVNSNQFLVGLVYKFV